MACLELTGKITVLMRVLTLLSCQAGLCVSGTCRIVCSGGDCITVNWDRVDFKIAEDTCRGGGGDLMTFQHGTDERLLNMVRRETHGDFWVGLRLPAGACSDLSAPLRGYEWTSGGGRASSTPTLSFTGWKGSVKVCSPRCVSLSANHTWTERLCSDQTDGFLCRTKHKGACKARRSLDATFFRSPDGCVSAICEHVCTDTAGGYKCSCSPGYVPDTKDPSRCKQHCGQQKCPAVCRDAPDICTCPDGYILNDKLFCEDIDECSMTQCEHECRNWFGSFECSCREGFVSEHQVRCVKAANNDSLVVVTPDTEGSVSNNTLKVSASPAAVFLWMWVFVAAAVVALVITVRFYVVKRQKLREQQPTAPAPVDNS